MLEFIIMGKIPGLFQSNTDISVYVFHFTALGLQYLKKLKPIKVAEMEMHLD